MASFVDSDEEYEEIPDVEKLAIGTHFLLSSPPGEIGEVLEDVRTMIPDNLLTEEVLNGIFYTYNVQNQEVVTAEDGARIMISKYGEVDKTRFLEPTSNMVYKVNHVEHTAELDSSSTNKSGAMEAERLAVDDSIKRYLETQYAKDTATCCTFAKDGKIIIQITGEKLSLRNFWSGRWRSCWEVSPGDNEISGEINVLVHYFEDGNVQMVTDKKIEPVSFKFSNASNFADNAMEFINSEESKVQGSLEEMYLNMAQETFKDMRRILPISKQKMDWSGAQMNLALAFGKKKA